ncbi:hypothetical protein [Sphingomonas abaci]|uniref:Uncharacterized protein n=1 Tax=Sphingomonas abaci TaxID=237611 RepID=A0A7W7AL66_9SPHN|nr:hypothetical protein [Sphingomonas abaci]MBB4619074.1 hypothetical protein [Sphingomonas abaci]
MLNMVMAAALVAQGATPPPADRAFERLTACRRIAADAERLACFDQAAAALDDARRRKDVVVLDRAEVRQAKRSLFGFSLPSIRLFGQGEDDEPLRQLVGRVEDVSGLPGGLFRFRVEGGGSWESTEAAMVPLRKGDAVTIKAGTLGSYVASAPGRRAVRVRRLR